MSDRREAIDKTARDYLNAARKAGNSKYTFAEARERVVKAVVAGDAKRANNNR